MNIFKEYNLYCHQLGANRLGASDKNFIVTSGTGSGKPLTYLGTILNYLLKTVGTSHYQVVKPVLSMDKLGIYVLIPEIR